MDLNKCRICFSEFEKLKLLSLFTVKIDGKTLAELVNFLSGIELHEDDKFPNMICIDCLNKVSSACETKRNCIEADEQLRKCIEVDVREEDSTILKLSPTKVGDVQDEDSHQTNYILEILETDSSEVFDKAEEVKNSEETLNLARNEPSKIEKFESCETPEILKDDQIKALKAPNLLRSKRLIALKSRKSDDLNNLRSKLARSNKTPKLDVMNVILKKPPKTTWPTIKREDSKNCHKSSKSSSSSPNPLNIDRIKLFSCDTCGFSSKRKKNLERHILAVHKKSQKFPCTHENCDRLYSTQTALKLHLVRDHDANSPYQCEKCSQKFSCESLFKIHNQRLSCRPRKSANSAKKVQEKSLECPHCDFKTAHKFSLSQHVKLIHLKIRRTFKCSYCNEIFSSRTILNEHIFSFHNLSHIRCPDCDQAFTSEDQLKDHKTSLKCNARKATDDDYEETSTGVTCKLCNRNYRNKKEWITHYFNHHKFKAVCDICNVQLSTYASLKNHKRTIHEKIKRFACDQCPKVFSAKHSLEFHKNTHSGAKPFSCKFCSFKASDRSSISKHQKKLHGSELKR